MDRDTMAKMVTATTRAWETMCGAERAENIARQYAAEAKNAREQADKAAAELEAFLTEVR